MTKVKSGKAYGVGEAVRPTGQKPKREAGNKRKRRTRKIWCGQSSREEKRRPGANLELLMFPRRSRC